MLDVIITIGALPAPASLCTKCKHLLTVVFCNVQHELMYLRLSVEVDDTNDGAVYVLCTLLFQAQHLELIAANF